jgi:hypothetical protein
LRESALADRGNNRVDIAMIGGENIGVFLAFGVQNAAAVDGNVDDPPRLVRRPQSPDPGFLGIIVAPR